MKYDLTQLVSKKVSEIEINYSFDVDLNDELSKHDNFKVKPIEVSGYVKLHGSVLNLEVDYTTTWIFLCDRCIDETEYVIEGSIRKSIVKDGKDEDEDIIVVESSVLDLYDLIYNDIVLNLPTQVMCDIECKGLCPDCGVNLNNEACECVDESVDPRFEKLKNLFTQN